ncbi:M90 family metallopeptidase [Ideonella paludis]|uniref:Zinc-dependent peptidase n=1 Tax=Ideonella paludis TaxID=1233411 RepID=A0ABS5DUF8_9BURK|nr:M90 family metallopeptidase [Ideonella paludis]MBQ0934780.1 zinc-dependent peptidase [Ideonella paludis]
MPWWQRLRTWHQARVQARHTPPEPLWAMVLGYYPFLARLSPPEKEKLKTLVAQFLAQKQFSGAQGLQVTDEMAVAIAAQACLPLLNLSLELYDSFVGIVVHPDEVVATREWMDDDGVVHEWEEPLSGEAMDGGPVMLSWHDALWLSDNGDAAYNVVIHEFAHVLDLRKGWADGTPPLPSAQAHSAWQAALQQAFEAFQDRLDSGLPSVVDAYGAEAIDEFFAVACEAFFVQGQALKQEQAELYALLAGYFQQDPAVRS